MNKQQKIDHIVLNVPNMTKFSYSMYFGKPEGTALSLDDLRAHARRQLELDFLDIDVLYDDVEGNDELVDPLPDVSEIQS